MTEYLFSVHHDYSKPLFDDDADVEAMFRDTAALNDEAKSAELPDNPAERAFLLGKAGT